MHEVEHNLLVEREQRSEQKYFLATITLIVVNLLSIGLLISFIWILQRHLSARRKSETDLARMQHILTEAQKIAHLGCFEYEVESRKTVWSEEEFRIYGLDPKMPSPNYPDLIQKHIHPDDVAMLHEKFQACLQTSAVWEVEHRIVRPDGSVRTLYNLAHPQFNAAGEFVRYIGTTLDITERKAAEDAVLASRMRLQAALASMSDAVFITDIAGQFVDYNACGDFTSLT